MNSHLTLAELQPITLTPAQFLAAFHPGPYCLRSFCDAGGGGGRKYRISAAELASAAFLARLQQANQAERQGIFFVVNPGGHCDDEITNVAAHFVEADSLPLDQQYANLLAFPLPPSIIVKTRKSLHSYWLLADEMGNKPTNVTECCENSGDSGEWNQNIAPTDGDHPAAVARFRPLQQALAAYFQGDPVIANPSRVMRLPGFFHNKQAPLLVTCLKFSPQQRYTQAQLAAALSVVGRAPAPVLAKPTAPAPAISGGVTGALDPQRMIRNCAFLAYAREQAATLSEPLWYAMITQLAAVPGGVAAIHALSQPYPGYTAAATDKKIAQFLNSGAGPMSCETLKSWGFSCPQRGSCAAANPHALGQPPWYQQTPRGERLLPGVLANELARHQRIFYAGGAYYHYRRGVYRIVDDCHCQKIVRHFLRPERVTMAQINDVLGQWTVEISRSTARLNCDKTTINLKNGRYDLNRRQLLPHDPDSLSTIQLAPVYDAAAEAPVFLRFLSDCLDPQSQRLVQELFGYLLIPETCAQKAFVLVGEGGAGKSTLLYVAQELLLGRCNVANIPWQSLGDRFKTAELFGMLANIFADLPTKAIEDNGLFKSITGEDSITAERKNKDPFAFKVTARLLFSCNSLPRNLGDRSEAFYRRLIIIPFLPPKPVSQRDPFLKDKLRGEAAGILNWALAGLMRLKSNQFCFSPSTASETALEAYRIAGSSVRSFVDERCAIDCQAQAPATQLFLAYQHFCQEAGLRPVSQKRFWMELKEAFPQLEKIKEMVSRRALYSGIELLDLEEVA